MVDRLRSKVSKLNLGLQVVRSQGASKVALQAPCKHAFACLQEADSTVDPVTFYTHWPRSWEFPQFQTEV
eukprot:12316670-Prorocentrum_lima.AAC.1